RAAKVAQKRIGFEIGIGKKPVLDAVTQDSHGRRFVSQRRVRLRDLINRLRIADVAVVDSTLYGLKHRPTFLRLLGYAVTQSFADLGLEKRRIQLKRVIEIARRLLAVLLVVFCKAAIKNDQGRVLQFGEAPQKTIILSQVKVAIERRTGEFYPRI